MRYAPLLACLALGWGTGGCVSKTDVANAPSYSMLVRRSGAAPVAPDQPTSAEGGNFRDDLRFAGDYRERVAFAIAHEYFRDGIGPAEISAPVMHRRLLGDINQVVIRYPVKAHALALDKALGLATDGQVLSRCIVVHLSSGLSTLGQQHFTVARQKDPLTCAPELAFAPYVELERMAETNHQCRARGEKDCVLYTNLPEKEAKRYADKGRGQGQGNSGSNPK